MPESAFDSPTIPQVVRAGLLVLAALSVVQPTPSGAQTIEGLVFDDLDGDGVADPDEPRLDSVSVTVYGPGTASGLTADGAFSVSAAPGANGVWVSLPGEPDPATDAGEPAWRPSFPDQTDCPAGDSEPVGVLRYTAPRELRANLTAPGFSYVSLGDSIAAGVSGCLILFQDVDYVEDVQARLEELSGATISVDNRAVAGWHSEDLLTPMDGGNANGQFIPNVVAADPDLVTISIGGNDFLGTEPGEAGQTRPFDPADLQESFTELIFSRQSVQEILSVLISELPTATIDINTVYDNLANGCNTTDFHASAAPVWNQMLRNVAWGQRRPVAIAEIEKDFAHQDINRSTCCGPRNHICFDTIHPDEDGVLVIEEAIMESLGRVVVPGSGSATGVNLGYQQRVATVYPTQVDVLGGSVSSPDEALVLDGTGASVDADGGWVELSGFDVPSDVTISRIIVGVRYRTTGDFVDDLHRFDASVLDFAAPEFTFTGWDTVTPLVGASGTNGNIGGPSVVNALPDVPTWRDVTATVTLNALDDGTATGFFTWPSPTADDLRRLRVRLTTEAVGGADSAAVEWDGAWAWVYGERARTQVPPGEVSPSGSAEPLTVVKEGNGLRLRWEAEQFSADYRVYRGVIGAWGSAISDPGAPAGGCTDETTLLEALPVDGGGDLFFLVSGLAGDLEGPLGFASDATPRTGTSADCP